MTVRGIRIHLRLGIALAFLLTVVPLFAGMLTYLYHQNSRSALSVATDAIGRTSSTIINDLRGLLSPVARVAEATAMFGKIDRNGLRRIDSLRYFADAIEKLPQLASLYIGFVSDGAFFNLIRLPDDSRFGPNDDKPPEGTRMALRMLDASSGSIADSYFYLSSWGRVVGVERSAATHDPRKQEWFSNAWQRPGANLSDAFVFPATGRPGLTVSHRVATDDGVPIAVVGADVELDALAALLDSKRIGRLGVIFLIDETGRVICHNRADLLVGRKGDALALNMADTFDDPVVARSIALWKQGGGNRFVAPLGPNGEEYIVDLTPFPDDIGKRWTVAVAVEVDEFIGPIRQATTRIVVIGTILISLVIMTVLWLSHQLTQPMRAIVAEADRIRHFDLDGPTDIRSRLVEVDDLARSVDAMKSGLRSFGAYVPKALVRDMILSGSASRLGGDRRHLTLLFTDIKGFTATSESMPPEEVMIRLSRYFHDMTTSIHDHGGTVDKFIGDAIMAFWNAPRPDENHAENACLAALGCLRANRAIDDALAEAGQPPMPTRFGLHTGEVVVGNVGSSDRMQYTALGSNVNLASRVESLNKQYGTQVLATGSVERIARHRFVFRQVDLAIPSGLSEPIALFELIGARDPESPFACPPEVINRCRRWQDAMDLYLGQRWREAEDAFRALAGEPGNAVLSALYLDRCARLLANPPGDDWDGAERFTSK